MMAMMMKEVTVHSSMDTGQVMNSMRRFGMRVEHQDGSDSAITDTHRCRCFGMITIAYWYKRFGEIEAVLSFNTEGDFIRLWNSLQGKGRNGKIGFVENHGGGTGMPKITGANITDMDEFDGGGAGMTANGGSSGHSGPGENRRTDDGPGRRRR